MRENYPNPNPPTVSVIIPTYNRPMLLKQAVSSLLQQSQPARQIIIVDDGSRPSYRPQITSIVAMHPSISLLEMGENRGVGTARNAGLAMADGEFVVFLDDDDLMHPRYLELNGDFLTARPESELVVCRSRTFITPPASASPPSWFWLADQVNGRRLQANPLREILRFPIPINAVMARRFSLGEEPFRSDLRIGEERYLLLTLAARGCRFAFHSLPLAFVRIHTGNAQGNPNAPKESVRFLLDVLASDLPLSGHDRFICHARLLQLHLRLEDSGIWPHLLTTLRSPHLSVLYGAWYLIIQARKKSRYRNLSAADLPEMTGWTPA